MDERRTKASVLGAEKLGCGDDLPEVGGESLPMSIRDHVRACRIHIAEEQRRPNPDNALIETLCNAVRFAREHCNYSRVIGLMNTRQ